MEEANSLLELAKLIGVNSVVVILIGIIFYYYNKKVDKALKKISEMDDKSESDIKEFRTMYRNDLKSLTDKIDHFKEMSDEKFSRINTRISDQNALILKEMSAINNMREYITKELTEIKEKNVETAMNLDKYKQDLIAKFDKIRALEASQNEMNKSIILVSNWIETQSTG